MKTLKLTVFFVLFALCGSVSAQQNKNKKPAPAPPVTEDFMRVAPRLAIDPETGKRCFKIRHGYETEKETDQWIMYCGKLKNFNYTFGTTYTLKIVKFDPDAEEMEVIKIVGQNAGRNAADKPVEPRGNRKPAAPDAPEAVPVENNDAE
jgi:hypothetical protein